VATTPHVAKTRGAEEGRRLGEDGLTSSHKVDIEVIDSGVAHPDGDGDQSELDGTVDGRVIDKVLDHKGHRYARQLGEL
jgi:hypothetical protein